MGVDSLLVLAVSAGGRPRRSGRGRPTAGARAPARLDRGPERAEALARWGVSRQEGGRAGAGRRARDRETEQSEMSGARRKTVVDDIGGVKVGGTHPIVVQSMTNTDTADAAATAAQDKALAAAGSELVRATVNNEEAAQAVPEIVRRLRDDGVTVPIIGHFHYNGHLMRTNYPACAAALDKYRI